MRRAIRIGTRGSELALWQARHVAARLEDAGRATEIVVLKTRGDRIQDVPLQEVEGRGFFTAEIEHALLERRVDLAVHSHKDLPMALTPGLSIAAIPARAPAGERLLVAPGAHDPAGLFLPLVQGARVGTSAPRRSEQLALLRPDLELLPLRGNVPTRVRRLREGRLDAVVLAVAGLDRLGLDLAGLQRVDLPFELLVPAPAQGALAVQTRADDGELCALCERLLAEREATDTVRAERALLEALGGGCNLPLGVGLAHRRGAWHANAFLGAGHPRPGHPARWCQTSGSDPASAVRAALDLLAAGTPTGQGPLGGASIALAGSGGSLAALEARLATLGARVVREVVVAIEDLDGRGLTARLSSLRPGDVLAVTSGNAARRLRGLSIAPGVVIAAVGGATAEALASASHVATVIGRAGARELARELALGPGARVLFPCAEDAQSELEAELGPRGVVVERLPLYRTRSIEGVELDGTVDARLYSSPSAVTAALAWERAQPARTTVRLALGARTAEALARAGLEHRTAPSPETEAVLGALVQALPRPPTGTKENP